jgi:Peptidase family M23
MSSPLRTPSRIHCWVALALVVACALSSTPALADEPAWLRPVGGAVIRPFSEPPARYAAGHRGVDFAAPAGTSVRAAHDGTVTFAGDVAGSLHVVVAHDGGIRTSYSYLLRVDVRVGQRVRGGQVVGIAGGHGDGHTSAVLHLGARIGDRYIDPMLLFAPTDLTKLVRLVSPSEPTVADEAMLRREAEEQLGEILDSGDDCAGGVPLVEQVCDAGEALGETTVTAAEATADAAEWVANGAVDLGLAALRAAGSAAAAMADRIERTVRAVARVVTAAAEGIVGAADAAAEILASAAGAVFQAVLRAGRYLYEHLTTCPQPAPVAHPKGSGNIVVAVGGLMSSRERKRRRDGSTVLTSSFDFRPRKLGYDRRDVAYFSYAADSPEYGVDDTFGDLHAKARLLAAQVKAWGAQHPGRSLDLIGHSEGGVVIDLFLMDSYRGHEGEYPKIENVLTYAAPHEGTPIANLAEVIDKKYPVKIVAGWAGVEHIPIGTPALDELSEDSSTMRELWSGRSLPRGIRYLSLVGSEDWEVPSSSADVPGGEKVVLPVGDTLVPDDHHAVLTDDDAVSAAQAQLSGGHPADSCGPFTDVGGALYSEVVRVGTLALDNYHNKWLDGASKAIRIADRVERVVEDL